MVWFFFFPFFKALPVAAPMEVKTSLGSGISPSASRASGAASSSLGCGAGSRQSLRVRLRHAVLQILPVPDLDADSGYQAAQIR